MSNTRVPPPLIDRMEKQGFIGEGTASILRAQDEMLLPADLLLQLRIIELLEVIDMRLDRMVE